MTLRRKAEKLAKIAYPEPDEKLYPSRERYIAEVIRRIDLRAGFVREYLFHHPKKYNR